MSRVKEDVLIPKSRVAVLIGVGGNVRNTIAKTAKVSLKISADGVVEISGQPQNVWLASLIIEAIGRGFSPESAMMLFNKKFTFELLHISDFTPKNPRRRRELRGRVIGTQGKIKHIIQKKTKTRLAIYGKTVGIIGPEEGVGLARRAIEMILRGAQYSAALGFLVREVENKKE